ncbi:D-tyrosyl-tRNA(Tyr) deacylase [Candidatus Microgenomates bacterium]|nr:MAG: D-tyrosyl-tRNA(Tyr) deacylase [Candidatus Microgenomates bacterium]
MRIVVQRVVSSKVMNKKTGEICGEIEKGILVLVGFRKGDTVVMAHKLANKLAGLRVVSDKSEKMNYSILHSRQKLLVVSQFTLYANTKGGNRPSFIDAEEPVRARELYNEFIRYLRALGAEVETGCFGKYMNIKADLDGPVTIILDLAK